MANPVVFIVGCPRSGTTLFRHIISAHPALTITPEAHWIPLFFEEKRGLTAEGMITPQFVDRLLEHPKFALFRLPADEVRTLAENGPAQSYASFLTRIFDLYGQKQGKALVGNKTPDAARKIYLLHALWPEARFVHLIRDGRNVALSLMTWSRVAQKRPGTFSTWKDDPVSTAGMWWELNVRRGREGARLLDPAMYHEVRYESLILRPEQECRALCAFLGLPFHDSMLRHQDTKPGVGPKVTAKRDWQPITAGMRDWRSDMTPEQVERFEAAVGDLLDELGYPRAVPRAENRYLHDASRIRSVLMNYPDWSGVRNPSPVAIGGAIEKPCYQI
jgi:hypothetical protein